MKLLEAHYDDAISPELFKMEQHRIETSIRDVRIQMQQVSSVVSDIQDRLDAALNLMADSAKTYAWSPDHLKKQLNQAFFTHIFIYPDGEITTEFTEPFQALREVLHTGRTSAARAKIEQETTKEPALPGGLSRGLTNFGQSLNQSEGIFQPKVLVKDSWLRGQDLNL
jgi:hypothetical protein